MFLNIIYNKLNYLAIIPLLFSVFLTNSLNIKNKPWDKIIESKISSVSKTKLNYNNISTFNTIPKINVANQKVFDYSEDITISKISTGWYEKENLFFSSIDITIINGSSVFNQKISFNITKTESRENVSYFSIKLWEAADQTEVKYIFGQKLEKKTLNLTGDTRFVYQHLNSDEKYSDVTPITLGDISYHDPRYSGHIIFSSDHNYVKFNDVLNQRNDCGGYSDQCRSDFSQNTNTWYKLTTKVIGRNNYNYLASNTWNVRDKIYQKHSNYNDNCFILNFQVDVWLVKNIWYVGFFWINSITNH